MANVGTIDRGIRLVIGIAAIAAVFVGPFAGAGWERIALGAVGIIMIVPSSIRDDVPAMAEQHMLQNQAHIHPG